MENEAMEIMENVTDVVTEDVGEMELIDCQSTEANIAGTVIKGLCIVGAIAGAIIYKKRHAIGEWADKQRIKKLEKKGYVVYTPVTEEDIANELIPDSEVE